LAGPAVPKKTPAAARSSAKDPLSKQIVTKGVFAQKGVKKPAGVPDEVWHAILHRRGAEELRQKLLAAYGGRCAITGSDGEPALEAARIDREAGEQDLTNSLLLRGDVRTLYDLNLIRIHPRTKKIFVSAPLKKSSYAKLIARQLRLPPKKEDRPSAEALTRRWEASGGEAGM
jgi:hypothetical protein